jgi:hypothetical protein
MIFRISVAAELMVFALAKTTQTASPSQDCQPLGWPWDTLNAQAPLAKNRHSLENATDSFIGLVRKRRGLNEKD